MFQGRNKVRDFVFEMGYVPFPMIVIDNDQASILDVV